MPSIPGWLNRVDFLISNLQWFSLLGIILLSFITERIIHFITGSFLAKKILQWTKAPLSETKRKQFSRPFGLLAFVIVLSAGVKLLDFKAQALSVTHMATDVLFAIAITWLCIELIDIATHYFLSVANKTENKFDDVLIPMISKGLKIVTFCIGLVYIAHCFTLDVKGIIAGMGIGGLALAFAAKDTLANLFGSMMIIIDRPFKIGDLVDIEGTMGTIEEVGFRSTRIRTPYDSLVSIPNSTLANEKVDNYGARNHRRLKIEIGVQYDSPPELIECFISGIRELIEKNNFINKESDKVYFNSFGDFSLNILIQFFWLVPNYEAELREKHQFFMNVLRLGNDLGIQFAFPTQSLLLSQVDLAKYQSYEHFKEYGKQRAHQIMNTPLD